MTHLCGAIVLLASSALAQTPHAVHSLVWQEVSATSFAPVATPNLLLEPGEAVRLTISIAFTSPGTPVTYQQPQPGGVAPVAGLAGSAFDVIASNAWGGTWTVPVGTPGFEAGMFMVGIEGSAFLCGLTSQTPAPANPVSWSAVWSPATWQPRSASFQLQPFQGTEYGPLRLWVDRGPTSQPRYGFAQATGDYGGCQVSIVPTISTGAIVPLCSVFAGRRRRV
jgi:hypothetical protein